VGVDSRENGVGTLGQLTTSSEQNSPKVIPSGWGVKLEVTVGVSSRKNAIPVSVVPPEFVTSNVMSWPEIGIPTLLPPIE
jgi:hypothetical protein